MRIKTLEWDQYNAWKPLRHGIELWEVEEVMANTPYVKRSRHGRYYAFGQTDAGRYISVVFEDKALVTRPVTAMPMSARQKREYLKVRGGE